MGHKMPEAELHAPAVSGSSGTTVPRADASINELMAEKEKIEAELTALSEVLDSHGVNMDTRLTTFDGFPRADIDIAQVRTTRARIIHLRNDYKALMSRIETALHSHYASLKDSPPTSASTATSAILTSSSGQPDAGDLGTLETPFAKVNSVVEGSPADSAGLKAGDAIRRFGAVNWTNHECLSRVAEDVQANEGRSIVVKVLRQGEGAGQIDLSLHLTPRRNWGGRGLLGCHLVPL